MIEYNNYDRALIVTGDGDFFCLIEYLSNNKKLARLLIPDKFNYSSLYRKFNKDIVFMNGLRQKLEYIREKKKGH
jgi:uncharacterized LabA/DUF88 family protein